jgi:hypothetical protein
MNDQVIETVVENTEPVEQTLDDLYKESGLEAPQVQTQATPQVEQYAPPATPDLNVPDPYDVEAHKAFIANLARNQQDLSKSLQEAQGKLASKERETMMAKLEEEISQASDFVSKESGIENPNLATFELNERARTDLKFKALWEGRNSSPQAKAAFTKSLNVIAKEISKKYEVRSDPQLVANRKALAASRQSSSTTTQEESNEPAWASANGAEFQLNWDRMVRNNN